MNVNVTPDAIVFTYAHADQADKQVLLNCTQLT